jgi:hypothetical protein
MLRRVIATVAIVAVSTASPAFAYEDRRHDPDDRDGPADIRVSIRKVFVGEHGRFLTVTVKSYEEDLQQAFGFGIHLDTRGGRRGDFRMSIWDPPSRDYCEVWRLPVRNTDDFVRRCRMKRPSADVVKGRVKVHVVRPNKEIRWWIDGFDIWGDGTTDRAPDRGWYPR